MRRRRPRRARRLDGQVVIVTGASSGIGAATASKLAAAGARVVATARRRERLEAIRAGCEAAGQILLPLGGDITSSDDRERLVRETLRVFGRIDALVNNAGYGQRGPLELVPLQAMRSNFETNVFSLVALTQLVIPHMRSRGRGRIVNVSSVAGRVVWPFSAVYGATKHALEAISDGLRGELAPFGIHVIVVQPGFVDTEFAAVADELSQDLADPEDLYRASVDRTRRRYLRLKRWAAPSSRIATLILRALAAQRPRSRYAAPLHAEAALLGKRLLPERVIDAFLRI